MAFTINKDRIMILDGAMGTMLQSKGLKTGEIPELLNITRPEVVESIHAAYFDAGANIVLTNTFGANRYKAKKMGRPLEEVVTAAVDIARHAARGEADRYVALDIAPCGKVLAPTGDLPFEEAVETFAQVVRAGTKAGADLIFLETFTDLYELKAAVLAAKENSDLPMISTMSFEANGMTFFGASVESMVLTLEGLGVDALGVNCSLGPKQLVPIVKRILDISSVPVAVKPNAGLPTIKDGAASYDITPREFAEYVKGFAEAGVSFVGGCCGTNPEYIKLTAELVKSVSPAKRKPNLRAAVCSPSRQTFFGGDVAMIGERLNPTGKKTLQAAIRSGDSDFILREAIRQQEQGADVLDVNMGLPDIDEPAKLAEIVPEIQAVVDLPLQLDSSNPDALERAARVYNGKPLINSVNGKKESLGAILPIAKKYGCAVLGLTLDESGIPETAEGRFAVAEKIVAAAEAIGIPRRDILIDCLVLTVSAQQSQAMETLKAVKMVKERLGVKTVLGVSNISFGLPARPVINRTMLAMALAYGLDAPIMNPGDEGMSEAVAAYRVLAAKDKDSEKFIEKFSDHEEQKMPAASGDAPSLAQAIARGLKNEAASVTKDLLRDRKPLDIIENEIVPALDAVGKDYETGRLFLPQLIKSAEAAKSSFDALRAELAKTGARESGERRKIILATVRGDIHDIGKNIVKTIMENYNFNVIDLGRDVPEEKVVSAAKENGAEIVGLSALMTTTVANMKKTIELLRGECPTAKIIVGGAVLTPRLAEQIGADFYAKDAMEGVRIAEKI
ncbi:MAG: homocysteine S-methyltransferase family protein [Synergistaceae bacterium]|nr:homocysteine S-methyltransferase family protein [Synergistaceae bacterium]